RQRGPYRQVDESKDVGGSHDPLVEDGYVLEQVVGVDVLLVHGADQIVVGHASEREHRRLVQLGVVKAVQEMDRSRAGGREADAQPSGVLGVSAGRKRGGLFVSDVYKTYTLTVLAQGFNQAVHVVAVQAE